MQRYQNIQRTIATERPEEDSSSQSCEQVPAGGGGGGGESDSDTESSQLSLGMGGGVPRLLEWRPGAVWQSVWGPCSMALCTRKESNGTNGGQDRGEEAGRNIKQTEVSHRKLRKQWVHMKRMPALWLGDMRQMKSADSELGLLCTCASRQFFQRLDF